MTTYSTSTAVREDQRDDRGFINGAMRSRCCGRYVPTDDKETHC